MTLMFLVSFCVGVSSHMILIVILYRHISSCSQYCSMSRACLVFSLSLAMCQYLLYSQCPQFCVSPLCSQCHSVLVSLSLYYQLVSVVSYILDVLNHLVSRCLMSVSLKLSVSVCVYVLNRYIENRTLYFCTIYSHQMAFN